jgi:hypothetical protein
VLFVRNKAMHIINMKWHVRAEHST